MVPFACFRSNLVYIKKTGRTMEERGLIFVSDSVIIDDVPRGRSSVGRVLEWHSRGRRFDPDRLHQEKSLEITF